MNRKKPKISKLVTLLALAVMMLVSSLFVSPPAKAYNASDCSDVYTGIDSWIMERVSRNKNTYVAVMNATNVPWQLLAAIHYRETNLSRINPANGQGLFQFVAEAGDYPYTGKEVSDAEFKRQVTYAASRIQNDYVYRNAAPSASVNTRKLKANESDITLIKNTLFSYNGRAGVYANQASHFGFNKSTQPYEGSPYVMNRFDCNRARMGIITRDYGSLDGRDTRYGAFTLYARLKGHSYWLSLQQPYSAIFEAYSGYPVLKSGETKTVYIDYRNIGNKVWYDDASAAGAGVTPTRLGTWNPGNRTSDFGGSWPGSKNRPTGVFDKVFTAEGQEYSVNPHTVKPGEVARFAFDVTAESTKQAGRYKEYFRPLVEGIGYIRSSDVFINIDVAYLADADFKAQSVYPTIRPGETAGAYFEYYNSGNTTWYDQYALARGLAPAGAKPTQLATYNPVDRVSIFGSSWPTVGTRPAKDFSIVYKTNGEKYAQNPHTVKPGESARFSFDLTAPENQPAGVTEEYFRPLAENADAMAVTTFLDVTVPTAATAKPLTESQDVTINPLNDRSVRVSFRNAGNTTWSQASTYLAITGDNVGRVQGAGWVNSSTPARMNESSVAPGGTATFNLTLSSPQQALKTLLMVSPKIDSKSVAIAPMTINLNVPEPVFTAAFVGQSLYPVLQQNSQQEVSFLFKNTGNTEWRDSMSSGGDIKPTVLAATNKINRLSTFNEVFATPSRPAITFAAVYASDGTTPAGNQRIVEPGEIARFSFTLDAPDSNTPGEYREWFQPILEGGRPWQMGAKAFLDVTVTDAVYSAKFRGQSAYPNMAPGGSTPAFFLFENTGNTPWYDDDRPEGILPIRLATTNPINRTSRFVTSNRPTGQFEVVYESDGQTLTNNQNIAQPGQVVKFAFTLTAPSTAQPGAYREWFEPVLEGGKPWEMDGRVFLDVQVTR